MEYLKDSGPETYGRLSKKTTTQSGTVTTEVYTYTVKGTTLQTVLNRRVSKGNSVISSQTKTTSSLDTGLELETIDELGVITRTTYDTSGRVIEEKYRADTEYEIAKSYKYLAYSGRSGANLKITTSDGTEEEIEYDSLRRERIKYITDPNLNVIKEAQAYHYNALGQVEAVSIFDNLGAGTRELKTFLSYDFWGAVCKEVTPSGATQIVERHKSLNTVTTYLQSRDGIEGKVTHKYNELGLLVTSTYPEFVTRQIYDGLGVLLETVDASGKSTRYTRDEAGRVTKKVFYGNPQIVIEMAFDSQSLGDQVTEIKVNGTVVGKRKYDAIGRVLTETKGAYTTSYEYDTLSSKPTKITRPDGQVINYELNLVLDEVMKYTLPDNKISNYTFHQPTGRLLTASNDNLVVEKDYYSNGTVKSETQHGRTANYRYSFQGLLLSSNDYFGQTETRFYDNVHRLIKVIAGDSTVALEYDSLDRVKTETITSVDGIPAVRHDYRYDAQSRILSKDTLVGGVRRQTERYKFAKNGKLSTISTEDSAGNFDTEGYAYDNLGRLIYCSYGGLTRPVYFHLGPISSQHFKFDLVGNITEVRSKFGSEGDLKSDTATYGYDSNGLCVTIKHSNPGLADVTLEYDENGNVRKDEQGRLHEYNVLGQLIRINAVNNTLLSEYSYGANGIQYKQTVPRQGKIQLFYGATGLMNEMQGDSHSHMLSINGRTLNRVLRQPNKTINVGLVGDYKNSTNIEIDKAGIRHLNYTVFGETP
jgi:YD repeat-containing protein